VPPSAPDVESPRDDARSAESEARIRGEQEAFGVISSGGANPPRIPVTAPEVEREAAELRPDTAERAKLEMEIIALDRARAELDDLKQDIRARKRYARYIFALIVCWLVAVFFLILSEGISRLPFFGDAFSLADSVIIALISGATANVLGLFVFVVRYLFPVRDKSG
jgi:hypothetical protein